MVGAGVRAGPTTSYHFLNPGGELGVETPSLCSRLIVAAAALR